MYEIQLHRQIGTRKSLVAKVEYESKHFGIGTVKKVLVSGRDITNWIGEERKAVIAQECEELHREEEEFMYWQGIERL